MALVDFFHPNTLDEAKSLVHKYENTKILAGGTDLVLNIRRGKEDCDYVVSLDRIKELRTIEVNGHYITIGAMATFTDLLNNEIIKDNFNSLIDCSSTMGSPQIRNVATLGGNIINAGSAADGVPCIIAMDGVLRLESVEGTREVTCEEYFNNYKEEKIKKDEILTKILIPKTKAVTGYYKLGKRNSLAIARVSTVVGIYEEGGIIKEAKICLGAVGRHPFRATALEKRAVNEPLQWLFGEEALDYLSEAVKKSLGGRKTMPFKREAIKGVFKAALDSAIKINYGMKNQERESTMQVERR